MLEVAALAASAEGSPPVVVRTVSGRRTNSDAIAGRRSYWPSAQRYSIVTFWPSTKPFSPSPRRNADTRCAVSSGDLALRYPISGICGCCARAASGHAVAPPMSAVNSRRFIQLPRWSIAGIRKIGYRLLAAWARREHDFACVDNPSSAFARPTILLPCLGDRSYRRILALRRGLDAISAGVGALPLAKMAGHPMPR